jgi:hypothetical protein
MQSGITVANGKVTGTLKFIEGGLAPGVLSGDGYFLALKWSDPGAGVTSLKVGLVPSESGMDLVECIDDTDRNGVFKITDKNKQIVKLVQSGGGRVCIQELDLSGLTLQEA